jgi:hypothetical protein
MRNILCIVLSRQYDPLFIYVSMVVCTNSPIREFFEDALAHMRSCAYLVVKNFRLSFGVVISVSFDHLRDRMECGVPLHPLQLL